MAEDLDVLMKCDLISGISPEQREQFLLPYGIRRCIPKGNFLIQYQETLDFFGIILSGSVHTMHIFPDGSVSIMDALKPGEVCGADLICTKTRISPYHAAAASPVQIFSLPAAMLTTAGFLDEITRLELLNRLLLLISQENMKKEYRLAILSQSGLRDRIMTYLTMQADRRNSDTFIIPFTREELASFLCVNRSALSHELSLLQQEGVISFRKNVFTLHRHDEL